MNDTERKNILFDVLDGVPPSSEESQEQAIFRKEIEYDDRKLEFRAEELGLNQVLVEYSSGCDY